MLYYHPHAILQKKERVAKQELPENNKFFCDTCDRGFATDETFKKHTANHEKVCICIECCSWSDIIKEMVTNFYVLPAFNTASYRDHSLLSSVGSSVRGIHFLIHCYLKLCQRS